MDETREQEFVEAILADPDDDGLRGAYGDWLLEQGDERGGFVHAQLQLAATPKTDEAWWERRRKVEAFLDRSGKKWARQLGKVGSVAWGIEPAHLVRRDWFERGTVERATFPNWSQFEKSFDDAWKVAPIREVRVNKWSDAGIESFFQPKYLNRVRGLWLTWDGFDPACTRVSTLFAAADMRQIERLRLFDRMLRPDGWTRLLDCRYDALRRLELVNTQSNGPAVGDLLSDLVDWSPLERVEHLVADASQHGESGVVALAESPRVAKLQSLSLAGNELGDESFAAIAASPYLSGLGELSLAANSPSPAGIAAIANGSQLAGLRRLDLGDTELGVDGAAALASSTGLGSLHELRLARAGTDDATLRALAGGPGLSQLRGLDLWRCLGGGEAVVELVTSDRLENLQYVRVGSSSLSDEELKAIRERFPRKHGSARTGLFEFTTDRDLVP